MNNLLSIIFIITFISCTNLKLNKRNFAEAVSSSDNIYVKKLVKLETRGNLAIEKTDEEILLNYFEIPLDKVFIDETERCDQSFKDALTIEKEGKKFLYWVIHPEDTEYYLKVQKYLSEIGLDSSLHSGNLTGHFTASRSLIVKNVITKKIFSLKTSSNNIGGKWNSKLLTMKEMSEDRLLSDWFKEIRSKVTLDHSIVMEEPIAFGINDLNMGMVIRSLDEFIESEKYYFPAFSFFQKEIISEIARLNNYDDIEQFIIDTLSIPLGRALGEFSAVTGGFHDSPHSQNFLIEFDKNFRPTGKVVMRDVGDFEIAESFVKNLKYNKLMKFVSRNKMAKILFSTSIGFLKGVEILKIPKWISKSFQRSLINSFYNEFEKSFSARSGISFKELKNHKDHLSEVVNDYSSRNYFINKSEEWHTYFKYANCLVGNTKTLLGEECPEFYRSRHKRDNCISNLKVTL